MTNDARPPHCWWCYRDGAGGDTVAGRLLCPLCIVRAEVNQENRAAMLRSCCASDCDQVPANSRAALCKAHETYCEQAMAAVAPRLLEAMVLPRAEVETFLASDWSPPARWTFSKDDWKAKPSAELAHEMIDSEFGDFTDPRLGFIELELEQRRPKHDPEREVVAWLIADEAVMQAWREHLHPYLTDALTKALEGFPSSYAGAELRSAILGNDPELRDVAVEGVGEASTGLSDDADFYLRLRYDPEPDYLFHAGEPDDIWTRYPVLPPDVHAMLEVSLRHYEVAHDNANNVYRLWDK